MPDDSDGQVGIRADSGEMGQIRFRHDGFWVAHTYMYQPPMPIFMVIFLATVDASCHLWQLYQVGGRFEALTESVLTVPSDLPCNFFCLPNLAAVAMCTETPLTLEYQAIFKGIFYYLIIFRTFSYMSFFLGHFLTKISDIFLLKHFS